MRWKNIFCVDDRKNQFPHETVLANSVGHLKILVKIRQTSFQLTSYPNYKKGVFRYRWEEKWSELSLCLSPCSETLLHWASCLSPSSFYLLPPSSTRSPSSLRITLLHLLSDKQLWGSAPHTQPAPSCSHGHRMTPITHSTPAKRQTLTPAANRNPLTWVTHWHTKQWKPSDPSSNVAFCSHCRKTCVICRNIIDQHFWWKDVKMSSSKKFKYTKQGQSVLSFFKYCGLVKHSD